MVKGKWKNNRDGTESRKYEMPDGSVVLETRQINQNNQNEEFDLGV